MSIVTAKWAHSEHPEARLWIASDDFPEDCFHCGEYLSDPYIAWRGTDVFGDAAELALHPECAVEFALRLLRDVHGIECVTHEDVTRPVALS